MDANERYEKLAREFYQATGLMAPGKDSPAAMGGMHTLAERRAAWEDWIGLRQERKDAYEKVARWIVLTQIPFDTASERERKVRKIVQVMEHELEPEAEDEQ